jgi:hypothetical protein
MLKDGVDGILNEIKFHRQQMRLINSEKDTLHTVLEMKIDDVRKTVKNE